MNQLREFRLEPMLRKFQREVLRNLRFVQKFERQFTTHAARLQVGFDLQKRMLRQ